MTKDTDLRTELRVIGWGMIALCVLQFLELLHRVVASLMVHHLVTGGG